MSYQIFYWIHIVSYISWLLAFVVSLFYGFKIRIADDAVDKRTYMPAERLATNIGAHIGALGILISGGVMSSIPTGPQWGWFDVVLYPWLALKQILFLIILVLVGFSIKRSMLFNKMLNEERVPSTETLKQWRRSYRMSMIIYMLVVINTVLGLTKPGIGM